MSSSRHNRMSLGPGSSPLNDASGRINRRTSLGGGGGGSSKHEDAVDSNHGSGGCGEGGGTEIRTLVNDWRRNQRNGGGGGGGGSSQQPPLLPPSSSSAPTPSNRVHRQEESYSNDYSNRSFEQADERIALTLPRGHNLKPASAAVKQELHCHSAGGGGEEDNTSSGLTALQRLRLRKKGQTTSTSTPTPSTTTSSFGSSDYRSNNMNMIDLKPAAYPSSHSSSSPADDEDPHAMVVGCNSNSSSSASFGTPSRKQSRTSTFGSSLGGAQRRVRRRTSLAPSDMQSSSSSSVMQSASEQQQLPRRPKLPPSYPSHMDRDSERYGSLETSSSSMHMEQPKQHSTFSEPIASSTATASASTAAPSYYSSSSNNNNNEGTESVDVAALQSRILAMERRHKILEREKMELGLAKAPLEARIRQMESTWAKERERYESELEQQQSANMKVNELYREATMLNDELTEKVRRLNLEAKTATSESKVGEEENDAWSERLKTNKEMTELRTIIKDRDEEIKSLRIHIVSLEGEVFGCKTQIQRLEQNYDELEKDYQELESSKSQNSEAEIQLQDLMLAHTAMTAQLNATCADMEEEKTRAKADVKAKEENWKNLESKLLFEISVLKTRVGQYAKDDGDDDDSAEEDPAILKARIEERDRRIADLEEKLLCGEQQRRALHNRIQELRGNIRVYVRTRPFLPNDGPAARQSSIDIMPDGESLTIQGKHVGEAHAFKFDKVFAPSTGQDTIFDEVSEFVQSALDGYHVCLFSYGQTGSGKTHTMQGSGYGAMRGIIPRAVEQILSQAAMMQSQRWTFTMKASFLEIYNEELRDLLVMVNSDGSTRQRDTRSAPKLAIKRNLEGKSYVDGINMVDIDVQNKASGIAQLEAVMAAASRARSVATTKMNAQSSRSHSVFMLHLCGSNEESGTTVQGALNLCDLAGSERLDRSGAASDAQRLKETQAINKSLSCLGDVFTHLANGSKHIPFRNSKLTYLLQDCLSGDGKALMFVNLSPTLESSNESLCSLRFAQRVNQVELGKATKHVQYGGRGNSSTRTGN